MPLLRSLGYTEGCRWPPVAMQEVQTACYLARGGQDCPRG